MKVGREAVPWASTKHQDPQLKGLNLRKKFLYTYQLEF